MLSFPAETILANMELPSSMLVRLKPTASGSLLTHPKSLPLAMDPTRFDRSVGNAIEKLIERIAVNRGRRSRCGRGGLAEGDGQREDHTETRCQIGKVLFENGGTCSVRLASYSGLPNLPRRIRLMPRGSFGKIC